ncbi:MAG TPA: hypothetical protein VFE34_14425 [Dongiaceae bacterium]|nr:hypothetical protein [Dongiaceae bacterium]
MDVVVSLDDIDDSSRPNVHWRDDGTDNFRRGGFMLSGFVGGTIDDELSELPVRGAAVVGAGRDGAHPAALLVVETDLPIAAAGALDELWFAAFGSDSGHDGCLQKRVTRVSMSSMANRMPSGRT